MLQDSFSHDGTHNGNDKQYKIVITEPTSVRFVLDILNNVDLDMILSDTCAYIVKCYYSNENNLGNGIFREVLDVYLTRPDTYSLIVDGKTSFNGVYQLSVDCLCDCAEPANDLPTGAAIFCDDFENYVPNEALNPQSTRWHLWDSLAVDVPVTTTGFSGKGTRIQTVGADKPRIVYSLEDDEQYEFADSISRFRISWKMKVPAGKQARYNLLHRGPQTGFVNWAYHVKFNTDGSGELRLGNPANAPVATFPYPKGIWINVVQIIDMKANVAELWINNNFVASWQFSIGYTQAGVNFNLIRMNAIEFVAEDNTDFQIDKICVWKKTGSCSGGGAPVCVENGVNYPSSAAARCNLYTSREWGGCNSVCDYGGTFIYRGDQYTGKLDASDFAPELIRLDPCVISAYGGNVPSPLYADVYIFSKNDNDSLDLQFTATSNPTKAKAFVFACNTIGAGGSCNNGQQCLQEIGNTGVYTPFTCDSFYYIVITGTVNTSYNVSVLPNGPCNANFDILDLDCPGQGDPFPEMDQVADSSIFETTGTNSPYQQCYGGARSYSGGEKIYKITMKRPGIVTLVLKAFAPMGMFLSSFDCGKECLNYAEIAVTDSFAVLQEFLPVGNFFLIIDKADSVGTKDFELYSLCEPKLLNSEIPCINFPFQPDPPVFKSITGNKTSIVSESCGCALSDILPPHEVHMLNGLYSFAPDDLISFYYRDSAILKSNATEYSFYYDPNMPTGMVFPLPKNAPDDSTKCFYYNGDSLFIWLSQNDEGSQHVREMLVQYADIDTVITATNIFEAAALSEIRGITLSDPITFSVSKFHVRSRSRAEIRAIELQASIPWHLDIEADDTSWLTVSPSSGNESGSYPIVIQVDTNHSALPRSATLRFVAEYRPDFFHLEVRIDQDGTCIPAMVEIVPSVTKFCEGEAITLTADVGFSPTDPTQSLASLYNYKWSNDSTEPSITFTPSVGSKTYSVTITNKDFNCPESDTSKITFVVDTTPPAPILIGPSQIRVCSNDPAPVLQVSVPSGQIVNWYNQAVGGDTLQLNSSSYTPMPFASDTFYAEAQFPGGCASHTRRRIILIVDPAPDIVISANTCESDFTTYTFVVSTTGNTIETNLGTIEISNNTYIVRGVPIDSVAVVRAFNALCETSQTVTPPVCVCSVSSPLSGGDQTICDTDIPMLTATVPGPNETVDWYDVSDGGMVLPMGQNTPTFSPPSAGIYYAEGRNTLNGCVSPDRTPVLLTINPTPILSPIDTFCSPDFSMYTLAVQTTVGAVLTSSAGAVSGANGVFEVSGIPAGQAVALTITDPVTFCFRTQTIQAPDCACLSIAAPISDGDAVVCPGAPFPVLSVSVAPGLTADWFNSNNVNVASDTLYFKPFSAGIYFVQARNPDDGCVSGEKTAVSLNIYDLPALSVSAAQCAPNRLTYSRDLSLDISAVLTADQGTVSGSNGQYLISGIPVNSPLLLSITDTLTGCTRDTLLAGVACPCTQTLAPPEVVGSNPVEVCMNDPIPLFQVNVGPGQTANWYDVSGGLLAQATTSFQPSSSGIFNVEALDTVSNCVSDQQTAFQLIWHPVPNLQISAKTCDSTLATYRFIVSVDPGIQIMHNFGLLTGSNGMYVLSGIPAGNNVQLSVVDTLTNCSRSQLVVSPVCSCDTTIAPPASGGDQTICSGQAFPNLTVATGPGQTAVWYNQLGDSVGQGLTFLPPAAGTYCAETRNLVDHCPSLSCTEVSLIVHPLPSLLLLDTICSDDLKFYNLLVKTNGAGITTIPVYMQLPVAQGEYLIRDIPVGSAVQIIAQNVNGCTFMRSVAVNFCPCPVVCAPINPVSQEICQGDAIPVLSVSVCNPATQTVDWFTAAGSLILNGGVGTLTYKPPSAQTAIFYTQTRDTVTQCISANRTPVSLTVRDSAAVHAGPDQSVCAGEKAPLSISISGTNGASWSASIPGGVFFPNNNALQALYYVPPAGADSVMLNLLSNDPPGPCPAVSDQMLITVRPLPFVLPDSLYCAADLKTWSVDFTTDAASVVPLSGQFTPLGNSRYRVSGIEKGKALVLELEGDAGCADTLTLQGPDCSCPIVAPPSTLAQVEVCFGQAIPLLQAQAGINEAVDWYDAPNGGNLLASDTTAYQILAGGFVYVQARNRITDCSSARVKITVLVKSLPVAHVGTTSSVCEGDTTQLMATMGTGYSYLWNTGDTTPVILVAPTVATAYYLTVTLNGCSANDSVQVNVNPVLQATINLVNGVRCFGEFNGAIQCSVTGGTPVFSYLWSNNSVLPALNGLAAGTYTVTVTDDANCQGTAEYVLAQPDPLEFTSSVIIDANPGQSDGSVQVLVAGGNPPYSFQWFKNDTLMVGKTNALLDSVPADFYAVTVLDSLGCTLHSNFLMVGTTNVHDEGDIRRRIVLYPNPTTGQLYARFDLTEGSSVETTVLDLLGRKVFAKRHGILQQDVVLLDLSGQPSGLYLVQIRLNNTSLVYKINISKK